MRDWFAHQYMSMDNAVIWSVAKDDIPPLKMFITAQLNEVK